MRYRNDYRSCQRAVIGRFVGFAIFLFAVLPVLAQSSGSEQSVLTTQTPELPNASDGVSYELGMKFRAARAGQIRSIRHWKADSETGTHVGRIWSADGSLLTSITFSGESGAGWQVQNLAMPLTIQPNTTYIVSVNVLSNYPFTGSGLVNPIVNGDLSSVADGANGVYGPAGSLPTNTYFNANYFRDVVFEPSAEPATGGNPIVLENRKAGTQNFLISLAQHYSSNVIAGYADVESVNRGGTINFKVTTAQPGPYSIEVYRIGYYSGLGGRLVASSPSLDGVFQTPCEVTDRATRLIECNWATSYSLNVGIDWTSGLYMAKLIHNGSATEFPIFFIVRDDSSKSDIVFQSSRSTSWAYNRWGNANEKYSLYEYNSTNSQRAYKVSLDRPSLEMEEYSNLLAYEYNMVRWLESQGYDASYVTNLDVHVNPALLLNHKVYLSVGHDEYWSKEMRDAVENARDAGVNLGFFSANTAYWRVRFEPSSSGVPNRVMACYKNPDQVPDPIAPTYRWRDSENSRPENALLGIMYIGDNSASQYGGFDFVVANSADPYYNNTGLHDGDAVFGLVGYEWDAVVDNGFTPSGLVVLSTSPVTAIDIAPGMPASSAQIANAVRYTAPSGAKVFSTGSIQWMWALDSDGVNPARVDGRMQQLFINAIGGMGVRPSTPNPGLMVP